MKKTIGMALILIMSAGCATVNSQLNYKASTDRASFAQNERILIRPVLDERPDGTTIIGKFVFSGTQGNVIHQPEGFIEKLTEAYKVEFSSAGFRPSTTADLELRPSLLSMDCSTDMNNYGKCNMSMRIIVVDHGTKAIDAVYETSGTNKKGVIAWGIVDMCSSAMEETTKLLINDVLSDIKKYIES